MSGISILDRFEARVDRRGEHHRWTGSADPRTGTGQFRLDGKLRSAQRAAWELQVGPVPAGVRVLSCPDDPMCVRVEHLRLKPSRRQIAPTAASQMPLPHHMAVAVAFPLYLAHLQHQGRTESTIAVYRSIYRRWLDRPIGKVPLDKLTDTRLDAAVESMTSAVPHAASAARSLLHGFAGWVEDQGI